jgi:hypothetical protein
MPRWPDEILDGCFFVFNTLEDAKRGHPSGGCGFFMSIPWADGSKSKHVYAITCTHVVPQSGTRVIRATKVGKNMPNYITARGSDWFRSDTDDLAILPIEARDDPLAYRHEDFLDRRLTLDLIDDYSIGIGDDVMAIGRFVDLHGQRTNRPLVRSGTIAAFPEFPVPREGEPAQDSYIAEMRSRSGFSGSPVYVFLPPPQIRYKKSERQIASEKDGSPLIKMFEFYGPWLMGVHWGEIKVKGPDAPLWPSRSDIDNDRKLVELGSGMIGIVPCERLAELLMKNDRVLNDRRRREKGTS